MEASMSIDKIPVFIVFLGRSVTMLNFFKIGSYHLSAIIAENVSKRQRKKVCEGTSLTFHTTSYSTERGG